MVMKCFLMPKLARCLHNLYLFMCGSRGGGGGGGGFGPPLKNHKNIGFL